MAEGSRRELFHISHFLELDPKHKRRRLFCIDQLRDWQRGLLGGSGSSMFPTSQNSNRLLLVDGFSYFPLLRSLRSQLCGFPKVGWYVENGIHVLSLLASIQVASDCVRVLPISQLLYILSSQLLLTDCRFCCHKYCHRLATRH